MRIEKPSLLLVTKVSHTNFNWRLIQAARPIRLAGFCDDVDPSTFSVEHYFAIDQCEQGVVIALANTLSRVKLRANLADEDVSGSNRLTTVLLDSATLRVGIATVTARSLTFLVCH